jgi:hypothetical protein
MSLDILKERFGGKLITSQYEDKIEIKEKIIEKLEEETNNLSNQVVNLKNEKNTLLQELNKARHFEDGAFSIKEKDYVNKIQSKENIIKEVKQKTDLLYEELNKKDERLSYKNNIIKNSLNIIKETKTKINYLNVKLQNSKNSKKELQLEIKKTYQDYIFKMNSLENDIKDRNDIINEHKQVLTENNKKLKDLSSTIQELKITNTKDKQKINELNTKLEESKNSLILENDTFKKKLNKKENYISELKERVENLSEKVSSLSETAHEKTILEKKLYEAEQFQEVVKNSKNNFKPVPQKKSKILNTDNLIFKLKEIAKQKQGLKPLTWEQWMEIPESNYLNELNHNIAKKIFNENNTLFLEDERKQYDSHVRAEPREDGRLLPLRIPTLRGYYSSKDLSDTYSDEDNVTLWSDLSGLNNDLIQSGDDDLAEYNAAEKSVLFKRRDEAVTNDNYLFTNTIEASEFTTFFVVNMTADSAVHDHNFLLDTDDNDQISIRFAADNRAFLKVLANDGTNNVSSQIIKDAGVVNEGTKLLLTCRKKPFNSGDGYGEIEWFLDKTSMGTSDDYDEDIVHKIQRLGDDNTFTGFKGHMYELAIYDSALSDTEISELQNYFIERTGI